VGRADRRSGFTVPAATAHPRRIEPEAAIDRAAVELIEREPRAQGFDHIQVVLDGVEVARLHALDESLQVLADVARDRIAAFQECPGSAAVFRRRRASSSDTDGIGSLRLHGEPSLDSDLVLPRVAKIILVEESLVEAELEAVEPDLACISGERKAADPANALVAAVDAEAVEVGVGPAEGDLEGVMEGCQRAVATDQEPPPDHGADLADPDMEQIDLGDGLIGHDLGQRTRSRPRSSAPGLSWSPSSAHDSVGIEA
jgi:hypothetical protein